MNNAHIHLILVHIPIVLVPVGLLILLLGMWRRKVDYINSALGIFIIATVAIIPAFLVGEGAEESVEGLPGVSENLIEDHEEKSELALWLTIGLGILSIAALFSEKTNPRIFSLVLSSVVIAAISSSTSLAIAGQAGGKIRHPEAFSASGKLESGLVEKPKQSGKEEDDD